MNGYEKALWQAYGLNPEPEYRFAPPRRWRFDFAFLGPNERVAVEIDGGAWTQGRHTRGKGFLADMEKLNHAALLGWTVLRFTPQQLKSGEAQEFTKRVINGRIHV